MLQRRQTFFRKYIVDHSILFIIYESLVLYYYILYVSEKSIYPSPLLRLLSITLTYADPQSSTLSITDLLRKIKQNLFTVNDGWNIFQRIVTGSFELSAFFLQFLSWWSQENYDTDIMNLPAPPPPKVKINNTVTQFNNYLV